MLSVGRRGVTLVELLVALMVGGIALGLVASISVREQRIFADLADGAALSGQLRDASAILPIDLRAAATRAGDVREARDTSVELRGTIASAIICDSVGQTLALAPSAAGVQTFSGFETSIDVGDTAWVLSPTDSTGDWLPYRISAVAAVAPGNCAATGPRLNDSGQRASRVGMTLAGASSLGTIIGLPIRVTRPLRFSVYRASDGFWYLGERDWSTANQRFNTIQPVSGPFLSPASGGLMFHYQDSTGAALATPVVDPRTIALVRVDLKGQTRNAARALGSAASTGKRVDSSTIFISIRNRR
jgi:prepilin-type N-terminal cleavage/methylation domain-containing protein